MADAKRYDVDTARDELEHLDEVLHTIATRDGHVRIVSAILRPGVDAGYIIISEREI